MEPRIISNWYKYRNELKQFYIDNIYDLLHYSGKDVDINEQVPGSAICNECIAGKEAFCGDCPKKSTGLLSRYYSRTLSELAIELVKNFLNFVVNRGEDNPCLQLIDVSYRDPFNWGYSTERVYLLRDDYDNLWTISIFFSDEELFSGITDTDKKSWINVLMNFSLALAQNMSPLGGNVAETFMVFDGHASQCRIQSIIALHDLKNVLNASNDIIWQLRRLPIETLNPLFELMTDEQEKEIRKILESQELTCEVWRPSMDDTWGIWDEFIHGLSHYNWKELYPLIEKITEYGIKGYMAICFRKARAGMENEPYPYFIVIGKTMDELFEKIHNHDKTQIAKIEWND